MCACVCVSVCKRECVCIYECMHGVCVSHPQPLTDGIDSPLLRNRFQKRPPPTSRSSACILCVFVCLCACERGASVCVCVSERGRGREECACVILCVKECVCVCERG